MKAGGGAPILPMEAEPATEIPRGEAWQYEPKWDGFRCVAVKNGQVRELYSKSGQPMARYFPEVLEALSALPMREGVLDGELVVPREGNLSFDSLLQRIHPAASRVALLSRTTPALFLAFDLLRDGSHLLPDEPLEERRQALERRAKDWPEGGVFRLSPRTFSFETAQEWFRGMGGGLDGVIAKRRDAAYLIGERSDSMLKIKNRRTADCVVGGFRYGAKGATVGSLLLGLYEGKLLHHVGFTSGIPAAERPALTSRLEGMVEPPGFTGRAPGGPSRWSRGRSSEWQPLRNELVVEVEYDHFTGGRFRHGTRLVRWRPDKKPGQCTMTQVQKESRSPLHLLGAA
ncbi:MAG: ATP-dependent DNA ligase [Bryobacteraceae bacterium]|nr:ATP-dependent DNA ligase [Bryobacteraceae bacterium]